MSFFKNRVNEGLNELWAVAYRDFKPYEDRLRSTAVREYGTDPILKIKRLDFKVDALYIKRKK